MSNEANNNENKKEILSKQSLHSQGIHKVKRKFYTLRVSHSQ